jgi:integrase
MKRPRGTGSIFLRGKVLWIRYYRNGRGFSESTHSDSKTTARAMLQRRKSEIDTGTFNPQQSKVRVSDLMATTLQRYENDALKSIADARTRWTLHLKPEFEHLLAANVTSDMLESYVNKRLKEGAEPGTVNRELSLLKRGFTLAMQSTPPKIRLMPHFPHLREDNIRTGFVTDAEAERIIAECSKVGLWAVALITTLFEFGFRVGEAVNLRVRQVDLANRTIVLNPGETKSGKGRTAVMTSRVYELLKACVMGKQPDDYVFTRDGKRVIDFRVTWTNVTKAVGLPDLLVHDLRRSAVKRMIRRGISQTTAMKISGHRTESIFRRYAIVGEEDLRDAARKLEPERIDTVKIQLPIDPLILKGKMA